MKSKSERLPQQKLECDCGEVFVLPDEDAFTHKDPDFRCVICKNCGNLIVPDGDSWRMAEANEGRDLVSEEAWGYIEAMQKKIRMEPVAWTPGKGLRDKISKEIP